MDLSEILAAVGLGIVANEMCDVSPWLAIRVVSLAARLQHGTSARAEEGAEDLTAYINDRPGRSFKLLTALGFLTVGALAGLRRHKNALSLETSRRAGEGLMTCAMGGLIWEADPLFGRIRRSGP